MIPFKPVISDKAFEYLVIQRGALYDLREDRKAWETAYADSIERDYADISPHLTDAVTIMMDIGSGLGGIDLLISQRDGITSFLIDGNFDKPEVKAHNQTFSNLAARDEFWSANTTNIRVDVPASLHKNDRYRPEDGSIDLVISLQAWCFHIAVEEYLEFALKVLRVGGRLIVDVRKSAVGWGLALQNDTRLKYIGCARDSLKFRRVVYERI